MNAPHDTNDKRQEKVDEAIAEYLEAIDRRHPLDRQQWLDRHNDVRRELIDFLATEDALGVTRVGRDAGADESAANMSDFASYPPAKDRTASGTRTQIGPYQLKRLLGAGGMGQVFEAIDSSGNAVAVKLLSPRLARSQESLLRFKQEGQIASEINHPRCVFVKAADDDNGQPFIVMELMTGRTLKDLRQDQKQLSVSIAVKAIIDVLDGLEEAHSHGMIHRDIKPANCYLEANGRVKVGDFGLARSMVSDSELTQTGDFVGTPLFASPEQVKGHAIDVRTDVYSVCATLYYLLTGKAPFAGSSATSVIARIVSEDPQSIRELNPQVPTLLEQVVLRGLKRDRTERFQTVAELRQALEPFVSGRQAIAAWGRRFAAYGLDCILLGIVGGIAPYFFVPTNSRTIVPVDVYLYLIFPVFIYFLMCEGWKNASIGKRLLRLHIVSQHTGEPPHRWRLAFRTISALLMMGVLSDLLLYAFYNPQNVESWLSLQWTGYVLSYLAVLSPLLVSRRGRLLMHDWISGTMVVDRKYVPPQEQLAIRAAEYHTPLLAATGYPGQFGEYSVVGLICSSESHAVLAGRDLKLDRDIWLHLTPATDPEVSSTRRRCARTTRLRWLTGGLHEKWRWDAYLACQGAPLKHWTATDSPLTWKTSRSILRQLVEEIDSRTHDGTHVEVQSLDQIWMDLRGRIVITDWSPSDGIVRKTATPPESTSTSDADHSPLAGTAEKLVTLDACDCAMLCETMRLTLCGTSQPLSSPPLQIPAIVPVHAQELLQSLTEKRRDSNRPLITRAVLTTLEDSAQRPAEATLENRFLGLGVAMLTMSLLLGTVASIARLGNQLMMSKISDQLVAAKAVSWLISPEHQADYAKAAAPAKTFPAREEMTKWLGERSLMEARLGKEYSLRWLGMGAFSRAILNGANLTENPIAQLQNVEFAWQQDELIAVNWTQPDRREPVNLQSLTRFVQSPPDTGSIQFLRRSPFWIIVISLLPFVILVIWSGLTRGGFSLRASGLCVVRSDGRSARWHLYLLRSILAAAPFLVVQFLITWIDLWHVESLWLSVILYKVLIGLFVVYGVFTIAFPKRAPHDWLLGTYLVPR